MSASSGHDNYHNEGQPIGLREIIAVIKKPVSIERAPLERPGKIMAANCIILYLHILTASVFALEVIEQIILFSINGKKYPALNLAIIRSFRKYYEQNKAHL